MATHARRYRQLLGAGRNADPRATISRIRQLLGSDMHVEYIWRHTFLDPATRELLLLMHEARIEGD